MKKTTTLLALLAITPAQALSQLRPSWMTLGQTSWGQGCPEWSRAIPRLSGYRALCSPWTANLYDPRARVPRAVAEYLTARQLEGGQPRDDKFEEDQRLSNAERSWLSDYRKSGYDRGHLAPAADFKQDAVAMSMSFLLSNIAPQDPMMNQRPWAGLESATRACARSLPQGLSVVTGTILGNTRTPSGRVAVPQAFYKLWSDGARARAWIIPNLGPNVPHSKLSGKEFQKYEVSLSTLRQRSGLNLMPGLGQGAAGKFCTGALPQAGS